MAILAAKVRKMIKKVALSYLDNTKIMLFCKILQSLLCNLQEI
jgi:hypothetical protein